MNIHLHYHVSVVSLFMCPPLENKNITTVQYYSYIIDRWASADFFPFQLDI